MYVIREDKHVNKLEQAFERIISIVLTNCITNTDAPLREIEQQIILITQRKKFREVNSQRHE